MALKTKEDLGGFSLICLGKNLTGGPLAGQNIKDGVKIIMTSTKQKTQAPLEPAKVTKEESKETKPKFNEMHPKFKDLNRLSVETL